MDDYTLDQVLVWYERIEREVLDISERVPLTLENESLKVPRLISSLMDACSLLDSVFRDRIPQDPISINGKSIAKKDCTIEEFAYVHSQNLDLPDTRTLMLLTPPRYRTPFAPWKGLQPTKYVPLPWWQTYNALKHDLLKNMQDGTLEKVLDALCGLHQVLAKTNQFIPLMMRRGWFDPGGIEVSVVMDWVDKGTVVNQHFIIMTKLFAVTDGLKSRNAQCPSQFPEKIDDIRVHRYYSGLELATFLGNMR